MRKQLGFLALAATLILLIAGELSIGPEGVTPGLVIAALTAFDPQNYDHAIIFHQRLPRVLIALYVGTVTACGGAVLQSLTRNPLAAPSTLGITGGATFFVVTAAFLFDLGLQWQGVAGLVGGVAGFAVAVLVARATGRGNDPRGLALILSGALTGLLLTGAANAVLLSDPSRRTSFLGWLSGNINHVYIDRLALFWWVGAAALVVLALLSRSITMIAIGADRAAAAGVDVGRVSGAALLAVCLGTASAVAICGPVAFVGLVVPHMVRPLTGLGLSRLMPAAAVAGASICLAADLIGRLAFQPYTVSTGVLMDAIGGIAFALLVRRHYIASPGRSTA
ncbi:FecCD family ABC transporter permease [Notoacmeibacter ruber]|uniref:Iron ABC transporter permease n=1 Tax=Notoacmeibacter ruber TaxID=2670375 RepID=A0A3L7J3S2_9HYPH|nr:iron ABC transporter permease [Notoacmeibacter ruber]RLQ85223.1 iron ABC transporter permease [Notoacmeibacter ruber]